MFRHRLDLGPFPHPPVCRVKRTYVLFTGAPFARVLFKDFSFWRADRCTSTSWLWKTKRLG